MRNKTEIDKKIIKEKISLLEKHLSRLKNLQNLSLNQLGMPDNFDIAAWNLRCALEATFDICAHILSRIPGVKIEAYKQMAIEMGTQKILPLKFAKEKLEKMAGYRNRLTHFYFEISPKEMYEIIQHNLKDFEIFLKYIKKLL